MNMDETVDVFWERLQRDLRQVKVLPKLKGRYVHIVRTILYDVMSMQENKDGKKLNFEIYYKQSLNMLNELMEQEKRKFN